MFEIGKVVLEVLILVNQRVSYVKRARHVGIIDREIHLLNHIVDVVIDVEESDGQVDCFDDVVSVRVIVKRLVIGLVYVDNEDVAG